MSGYSGPTLPLIRARGDPDRRIPPWRHPFDDPPSVTRTRLGQKPHRR